ncbi:MAG: Fic family protein [Acidobacteria bacterium]|nr:Fic family protein [Acidobacteriota bacterium]
MIRRLSVETGILEQLYDLDRGTTEALVTDGFAEELVSRSGTDIEPSRLIDILRDQEAAIQLVIDCIANNRTLSKGVIHELHAILTAHQETTTAIDQFGNRLEIPLLKGAYKRQPNNPRRPDGATHEYCPPFHIETEMDNLLAWLSSYDGEDPIIVAAWLHHRFTQIHPYQDGKGRLARVLTTLVLLKAELLPLVVDRDLRVDYIKALESADGGSLNSLSAIFARLERQAILQALSVDSEAELSHQKSLSSAAIESLAAKFNKRRDERFGELRQVNEIAIALRAQARTTIGQTFELLRESVPGSVEPHVFMTEGGPDRDNAHWYRHDVVQSARVAGTFANFNEDHYFMKGAILVERERLVFVVSFHHVGRELSGIMEATAFSRFESMENSEDRDMVSKDFIVCSMEPLVFTYKTRQQDIADSFARWLDASMAIALQGYGERL